MTINYTVHHKLLSHPCLEGLANKPLVITWIIWCQIIHLSYYSKDGRMTFRQGNFVKDLKIGHSTAKAALNHLMEQGMIKCITRPQYKTNEAGVYEPSTACIRISQNLYQEFTKPVSGPSTINNSKRIIKGDNDSFKKNQSHNETKVDDQDTSKTKYILKTKGTSWEQQNNKY